MRERRREDRTAHDPTYDAYHDRRQPFGIVATLCQVTGGEYVRARVDYLHLARVMRAKWNAVAQRGGTNEWR